eukprot:1552046-Lingulodinium_polyedra.AAC.1
MEKEESSYAWAAPSPPNAPYAPVARRPVWPALVLRRAAAGSWPGRGSPRGPCASWAQSGP